MVTDQFVLCVSSDGHEASLAARKVYRVLPDEEAAQRGVIRVMDDSGEDYLFPASLFVPIEVPQEAEAAFSAA
jgi:hypothetical protein